MTNRISRWMRFAAGLLIALGSVGAHAAPAHCSYGYQDSSCLTPQYRAPQTAPTCSTDAGWTTLTPAKWIGSRFTSPQCSYQAPPTCLAGYTETSPPVWNGASWSAPGCTPTFSPSVPGIAAGICTAAVASGNVKVSGIGYGTGNLLGSQFSKYQDYTQVTWQIDGNYSFRWPTWSYSEVYPKILIGNTQIAMGLPQSAETGDYWYFATYTGPTFVASEGAGDTYNTYLVGCALTSTGSVDGVVMMPDFPVSYDAN